MSASPKLPENISKDCIRLGYSSISTWLSENKISVPKTDNFHESLALAIQTGALTLSQLNQGIAELDDNSDKTIYLYTLTQFGTLIASKKKILVDLYKRKGIKESQEKWFNGTVSSQNPTFVHLYWDDEIVKIKYSEIQYVVEPDIENNTFNRTEKRVNIIYVIDLKDGLVQIRFDKAGTLHRHRSDTGKSTEAAYETYYKDLLKDLFPNYEFKNFNLNTVANHIANNELKRFRIKKGVTTVSDNAKQTFAVGSSKGDIRNIPEYEAAAANGTEFWLSEDLIGSWVAAESEKQLKKDLFMRIYRRTSQIRVQRGCLEKELNYGIDKIRQIQASV